MEGSVTVGASKGQVDDGLRRYRSKEEIFDAYLRAIQKKSMSKSKMMYAAESYINQLYKYFPVLEKLGFVEYDRHTRMVHITEKGKEFLALRDRINEMMGQG